jgi:hypothetical protein
MPTVTLELPALHPAQATIKAEARRFNVVDCGRRWGKTTLGIDVLMAPTLAGYPVAFFSPTYKMLADVWREMRLALGPVALRINAQEHRIELVTGGVVDMWSLDVADAARGRKYKRVVLDEAAMVSGLENAWQAVIRPTLTDYAGDAWFLSTPKGLNFFHTIWARGLDNENREWKSWKMPTVSNPFIDPAEVEAARQELPELTFQQEYLADFLADAGAVFRGVRRVAVLPVGDPEQHKGHRIVSGLDFAQKVDFTVHSIGCADCHKQVEIDRFNRMEWALARGRIRGMYEKWGIATISAEANSIGGPNIEEMQRDGLPVTGFDTTPSSKPPLIQSWALAIEKQEWQLLKHDIQTWELEAYQMTPSKITGRPTYAAPEGGHDDTVIAGALMNRAALYGTGDLMA